MSTCNDRAHWPWEPWLLHTVLLCMSVWRGSLHCQLSFLWQLWVTEEIKYFVKTAELRQFPPQKLGSEHFAGAWYFTNIPSGVCRHHTFPLLEDTLSTLMSSLPMLYPFSWNTFVPQMNNPSKPREVCFLNAVLPLISPILCIRQYSKTVNSHI